MGAFAVARSNLAWQSDPAKVEVHLPSCSVFFCAISFYGSRIKEPWAKQSYHCLYTRVACKQNTSIITLGFVALSSFDYLHYSPRFEAATPRACHYPATCIFSIYLITNIFGSHAGAGMSKSILPFESRATLGIHRPQRFLQSMSPHSFISGLQFVTNKFLAR